MNGLTSYHSPSDAKSSTLRPRHAFISLIIIAYFFIACAQMVPEGAAYEFAFAKIEPIVFLFGLKQRWSLFAPDIRRMNQYSTCLITMQDGTDRLYEWPRDEETDRLGNFKRMRLRHFETNCWEALRYQFLRPFSARYMAKCNWTEGNPPQFIRLIFNGQNVPDFQKDFTPQSASSPWGYTRQTTFPYLIRQADAI